MANRILLGMAQGLAQGLDKSVTNLQNIMKASYDIKQNQELLNLKKKSIEAEIDTSAWEKDYKLKALNLTERELAVKEHTANMADEETRGKIKSLQTGIDFIKNLYTKDNNINNANSNSLDTQKDLGWSWNSGTGATTVTNRGGQTGLTEQWRNDIKTARDSVINGDMSVDEATSILEDSYPDKASNIMEFKAMWSGLAPKGGKKATTQPTTQSSGRIRVKNKEGQTGTIDPSEFDANLYEKI